MLDNKKINNNNTNNKKSFLEEEIEEINTNSSNLQRKKEEMRFRANAPKAQISNISNGYYSQRRINNMTNKINIGNISSDNDLQSTLEMFAKAEELKQQNEESKKAKKEESFWDKLFKPFKCGD